MAPASSKPAAVRRRPKDEAITLVEHKETPPRAAEHGVARLPAHAARVLPRVRRRRVEPLELAERLRVAARVLAERRDVVALLHGPLVHDEEIRVVRVRAEDQRHVVDLGPGQEPRGRVGEEEAVDDGAPGRRRGAVVGREAVDVLRVDEVVARRVRDAGLARRVAAPEVVGDDALVLERGPRVARVEAAGLGDDALEEAPGRREHGVQVAQARAGALAEDREARRIAAEGADLAPEEDERGLDVRQRPVARRALADVLLEGQEPKGPHAVVDGRDDGVLRAREHARVVGLGLAEVVAAAGHEHDHGQRRVGGRARGAPDVEHVAAVLDAVGRDVRQHLQTGRPEVGAVERALERRRAHDGGLEARRVAVGDAQKLVGDVAQGVAADGADGHGHDGTFPRARAGGEQQNSGEFHHRRMAERSRSKGCPLKRER